MYYNITKGEICDFTGKGFLDLSTQVIRTPCDPDITFNDDPLRILRVIRFSTRFGWGINKDTWLGMIKNAHRINIISQERITDEISKIICTDHPSVGIRKMLYCGILHRVMPDIYDMQFSFESKNPTVTTFDHTMNVIDEIVDDNVEHRLAGLFHDVGRSMAEMDRSVSPNQFSADIAMADLRKMKYPNDVVNAVACAIRHHEWFSTYTEGFLPPDSKIRKLMNSCGINLGVTLDLMNANNKCRTFNKKKTQVLQVMRRIEELDEIDEMTNIKLPID
jgi:poly(A) polymerase